MEMYCIQLHTKHFSVSLLCFFFSLVHFFSPSINKYIHFFHTSCENNCWIIPDTLVSQVKYEVIYHRHPTELTVPLIFRALATLSSQSCLNDE